MLFLLLIADLITKYEIENNDTNGCNGNLQGISKLVQGMKCEDAIQKLRGIKCGFKSTSCPDQLSYAIEAAMNK